MSNRKCLIDKLDIKMKAVIRVSGRTFKWA